MTDIIEVLFTCDTSENNATCTAWDFRTGTNLMTYKGGGIAQANSLCLLGAHYVLAANLSKPLMHVWPINGQEQISSTRFVLPGRVNALTLSPDGIYLVAGIQEAIYVWHLTTGRMLNTLAKHYQTVNCLRFTDDASHFISAGQDGAVLVWNLTQIVGRGDDNQQTLYSFNDHGLPVTDVHVGAGGMRANMFTVSLDRTCKVYDLSNGELLLSVVFTEALQSVTTNALETHVFVGTTAGQIYEFHVDSAPRTKEYHMEKEHTNVFVGHKTGTAVNCLVLSNDEHTLISGGQDQQVCIWHIPSRQLLKVLQQKGAVTNLTLRVTNPTIFHPEHKQPQLFWGNLKRMIDPPEADDEVVISILVTEEETFEHTWNKKVERRNCAAVSSETSNASTAASQGVSEENAKLRAEIQRLQQVNKQLFELSTKQLLRTKK